MGECIDVPDLDLVYDLTGKLPSHIRSIRGRFAAKV